MSDRSLRLLERQAAQGDQDAGARLLRERMRAGEVSLEGIRLAAYCGDMAAAQASGSAPAQTPHFFAWCEELAMWGPGVCVRAALVLVDHLESAWCAAPSEWLFRSLYQELLNELECPCVHHERLLRRWQRRAHKTVRRQGLDRTWGLGTTAERFAALRRTHAIRCLIETAAAALASPRRAGGFARDALRSAARALAVDHDRAEAEAEVRRRVEAALRAWALSD